MAHHSTTNTSTQYAPLEDAPYNTRFGISFNVIYKRRLLNVKAEICSIHSKAKVSSRFRSSWKTEECSAGNWWTRFPKKENKEKQKKGESSWLLFAFSSLSLSRRLRLRVEKNPRRWDTAFQWWRWRKMEVRRRWSGGVEVMAWWWGRSGCGGKAKAIVVSRKWSDGETEKIRSGKKIKGK